jgi:two-component system, chemotaxis family, sensor kinase Cph1
MSSSAMEPVTDLSQCVQEPIHIPGSIQPHGVLLALKEPGFVISQASENTESVLGVSLDEVLGKPLQAVLGSSAAAAVEHSLINTVLDNTPVYLLRISPEKAGTQKNFDAIAHRYKGVLVLELEESQSSEENYAVPNPYKLLNSFMSQIRHISGVQALVQLAAEEVRKLTGFDRVLVYQFDSNWHGHVVAESKIENCASYLDLWFPASDIPQQARRLYELNRVRLIANANYEPVPVIAKPDQAAQPLDLSFAALRSVSPVHIEYLNNMGVAASMSISILKRDGQLWGLIACHHLTARCVPIEIRTACDFLAQTLSVHLDAHEQRAEFERRLRLKSMTAQLLSYMALEEEFIRGLTSHPDELLSFAAAQGAAVLYGGRCFLIGRTPPEEAVNQLVDWLIENGREEIYFTDQLSESIENGEIYREKASGVLAISISKLFRSYVLWFRPEVIQSVSWGGDPRKPVEQHANGLVRISPRKSFDSWKEIVHGHSLPWQTSELEAASDLRNAVIGIVLRKAEEMAELTDELQRSNKELEAFSYSVSHDLRAPFRHIVGYSELLRKSQTAQLGTQDQRYVDTIIESAQFAGKLVDNLLGYSQVGRARLNLVHVNMTRIVRQVVQELMFSINGRVIRWEISDLPDADADVLMIKTVWQNLLQNAIKYTRGKPEAIIEIDGTVQGAELVYSVKDNGVGFDPAYKDKLFGVFQRLHLMEQFEGTGIGLANIRRIISRHHGRTWADGEPDKGAVFTFTLPNSSEGKTS